jgi:hypothetical protein
VSAGKLKPGTRTADPARPLNGDLLILAVRIEAGLTQKQYREETGITSGSAHDLFWRAYRYKKAADSFAKEPTDIDALVGINRLPATRGWGYIERDHGIRTLHDIAAQKWSREELRALRGFGKKSLDAIEAIMREHGLSLRPDDTAAPDWRTPEELRHAEADRLRHHDYLALVAMYRRHGADAYARMILAAGREAEGYPPVGRPEPPRLSERGNVVAFPGCELPGGAA